jgi:hypothetical protein
MSLEVFAANGEKIFDANWVRGGPIIDAWSFGTNQNILTFPDFPGKTLYVSILIGDPQDFSIDYNLGYPRLTVQSPAGNYFFVCVR